MPPQVPHFGRRKLAVPQDQMDMITAMLCTVFDSIYIIKCPIVPPSFTPLKKRTQHLAYTAEPRRQMRIIEGALIVCALKAEKRQVQF